MRGQQAEEFDALSQDIIASIMEANSIDGITKPLGTLSQFLMNLHKPIAHEAGGADIVSKISTTSDGAGSEDRHSSAAKQSISSFVQSSVKSDPESDSESSQESESEDSSGEQESESKEHAVPVKTLQELIRYYEGGVAKIIEIAEATAQEIGAPTVLLDLHVNAVRKCLDAAIAKLRYKDAEKSGAEGHSLFHEAVEAQIEARLAVFVAASAAVTEAKIAKQNARKLRSLKLRLVKLVGIHVKPLHPQN